MSRLSARVHAAGLEREPLSTVTLDALRATAIDLVAATDLDPMTIDVPDLLQAMVAVSASRPSDGDGELVRALLRLAALALLWSESADDLAAVLDHLIPDEWAEGDPEIEALLSRLAGQRRGPAGA